MVTLALGASSTTRLASHTCLAPFTVTAAIDDAALPLLLRASTNPSSVVGRLIAFEKLTPMLFLSWMVTVGSGAPALIGQRVHVVDS